jgi:hypothetical protein
MQVQNLLNLQDEMATQKRVAIFMSRIGRGANRVTPLTYVCASR